MKYLRKGWREGVLTYRGVKYVKRNEGSTVSNEERRRKYLRKEGVE